jgi:CheY-like chemotaxis protein
MDLPVDQLIPLLIDDDADHALFMRRTFRALRLPWPLPALGSGEEAFAYLEGGGTYADRARYPLPSLILLDLRLPGTSGLAILQWIRARSAFAETTVFVMSSSGLREDVELALAQGADHYFVKPLTLDGLEGTTRLMIARWGLRKAHVPPGKAFQAPGSIFWAWASGSRASLRRSASGARWGAPRGGSTTSRCRARRL